MLDLIDFNNYPKNLTRVYGGRAGNKYAIIYNKDNWIIKFPRNTMGMRGNVLVSYTTSPLSEYLGSKIYEMFDIPVHETLLGFAKSSTRNRIVVACRDFLTDLQSIMEFHNIKNTQFYSENEDGGSGAGTNLNEVLETIVLNERFEGFRDKIIERFWDMFVIDFFIENTDRNNTNWGLIVEKNQIIGLAPVYDNGNAFSNKKDDKQFIDRLELSENDFENDAYKNYLSIYETDDKKPIHAYELIQSMQYDDCNKAIIRFAEKLNYDKIVELIRDIPSFSNKIPVMSDIQKEYYLKVMKIKIEDVILPTYQKLRKCESKL